jgi:hypothetical protein
MTGMTEQFFAEMNARIIARAKAAAEKLGTLYVLHPVNKEVRKDQKKPILDVPRYLLKA